MEGITAENRWRGGRVYRKYTYTIKDISEVTGRAIGTIRNDISHKKFNPGDLRSIIGYILKHGISN